MTAKVEGSGGSRAFAVLPEGQADPAGLRVVGRVDRFDLGLPIAARIGADVLLLSERLVDAEDGWDAVRGIAASSGAAIWVVADGSGRSRERWRDVATRVLGADGANSQAPLTAPSGDPISHELVLVLGAKGGVGKTFVSANLAFAAAAAGLPIAAVDLDVETGDLALRLGIEPGIDLPGAAGVSAVPPGWKTSKRDLPLWLLASKPRPEYAGVLDESLAGLLLSGAQTCGKCTIVDTPSDPDHPAGYAALDRASAILLVSTLNPGSVRQAKTMVDLLKRLKVPVRDKLLIVVNRYSRRSPVDAAGFRELVGHEPHVIIGDIGVAADLEAYYGCPTMGSRGRRRIAEPILKLAHTAFRHWPTAQPRKGLGASLLARRRRQHGYLLDGNRGWM